MDHKQKVKMARKMLTWFERKMHTPIFLSEAWLERAKFKKNKILKQYEQGRKRSA